MQSVKGRDTALHLAIADRRIDVIAAIIEKFREGGAEEGRHGRRPNLDLKNAEDQTPLSMALSRGLHEIAMDLLRGGMFCRFASYSFYNCRKSCSTSIFSEHYNNFNRF